MLAHFQQLYTLPLSTLAPLIVILLLVLGGALVTAYVLIVNGIERRAEEAAKREARDRKRRMSR